MGVGKKSQLAFQQIYMHLLFIIRINFQRGEQRFSCMTLINVNFISVMR